MIAHAPILFRKSNEMSHNENAHNGIAHNASILKCLSLPYSTTFKEPPAETLPAQLVPPDQSLPYELPSSSPSTTRETSLTYGPPPPSQFFLSNEPKSPLSDYRSHDNHHY